MKAAFDWKQWLANYFGDPITTWGSETERQVTKLNAVVSTARSRHGLDQKDLVDALIAASEERDIYSTQPIYLTNLGGCGSHWISRMMAQAGGLADAGEVYLPPHLYQDFLKIDQEYAARILDAIEMAHGLLYGLSPAGFSRARMINSAHGCEKIAFHRTLRPDAKIIHLTRDPRDRTLSVSFRKAEFRRYEATGLDDFGYMLAKARRSQSYWDRYRSLKHRADIEISYESFRRSCPDMLKLILATVGIFVPMQVIEHVAWINSPEFLRSSKAANLDKGNLDESGVARSWHDLEPHFRRTLHSVMASSIEEQGYSLCDCFPGSTLPNVEGLCSAWAEAVTHISPEALGCYQVKLGAGTDWVPGTLSIDRAVEVTRIRLRLRNPVVFTEGFDAIKPFITDLCAAGCNDFDDTALSAIGPLPRLQYMDLARTGVREPVSEMQFPSLLGVNLSACAKTATHPAQVRDY